MKNSYIYFLSIICTGLGYGMICVSSLVALYYTVIIGWCLLYLFMSFTGELPWERCREEWMTQCKLNNNIFKIPRRLVLANSSPVWMINVLPCKLNVGCWCRCLRVQNCSLTLDLKCILKLGIKAIQIFMVFNFWAILWHNACIVNLNNICD